MRKPVLEYEQEVAIDKAFDFFENVNLYKNLAKDTINSYRQHFNLFRGVLRHKKIMFND